jgi:hypothetical protein
MSLSPTRPHANKKAKALALHKRLGLFLFAPLLWTAITGMGFTLFKEILGNKELGKTLLHLHTLEVIGLEKVYPFVLGLSVIGIFVTAILFSRKQRPKKDISPD